MAAAARGAALRGLTRLCAQGAGSAAAAASSRPLFGGRAHGAFPAAAAAAGFVARIGLPRASVAHWPRRALSAEAAAAQDAAAAQPAAAAASQVCCPRGCPAPVRAARAAQPLARLARSRPGTRVTRARGAPCADAGGDAGRAGGSAAAEGQGLGRAAARQGLRPPGLASLTTGARPARRPGACAPSWRRAECVRRLVQVAEYACGYLRHLAGHLGVRTGNVVRLPKSRKLFTVLRSPHVNKTAREQFAKDTYRRLICVYDTAPETLQVFYREVEQRPPVGVLVKITDKGGAALPAPEGA